MKKNLFILGIMPMLLLVSCSRGGGHGEKPNQPSSDVATETNSVTSQHTTIEPSSDSELDKTETNSLTSEETSSEEPSKTSESSTIIISEKEISVVFYESAVNCQPANQFFRVKVHLGDVVPRPEGTPTSSDPAFNKFTGWSAKQLVMSDDDYWDFAHDRLPIDWKQPVFRIYGQWTYVE